MQARSGSSGCSRAFLNPTLCQATRPRLPITAWIRSPDSATRSTSSSRRRCSRRLLGQPLDLATINIARGRDVGLPTWNELRQQIYDQLIQNTNNTNGSALAPYTNWADVGDHLKTLGTLVNLIAAYARDGDGDSTMATSPPPARPTNGGTPGSNPRSTSVRRRRPARRL